MLQNSEWLRKFLPIEQTGDSLGVRDFGALESALAQPKMTFAGKDLYPTLVEKGSARGFSLVMNHPLADGNKRVGNAAMEIFLFLNGYEFETSVDDQLGIILRLAAGDLGRDKFCDWVRMHITART